jgi:branched-chain amino acid transport system permease protein
MLGILLQALAYSDGLALTAAGITIIYMSTGTFNFAHASMTAWGFYMLFAMLSLIGGSPYVYLPIAGIWGGIIGIIIYYVVNRWLLKARADMITLMMSTLGVDLILFASINIFADYLTMGYKLTARLFVLRSYDVVLGYIGSTPVNGITIFSLIIVVIIIFALQYFLTRTRFGVAMRTTIENPTLATVLGINPELVYLVAWFLGGFLAGLGGGVLSLILTGTPNVGMLLIVPEFAGSIVGGLYSIFGSLLGGFLIGMGQKIGIFLLSSWIGGSFSAYEPLIPLMIMAVTLLLYPRGLGGLPWSKLLSKFRREEE